MSAIPEMPLERIIDFDCGLLCSAELKRLGPSAENDVPRDGFEADLDLRELIRFEARELRRGCTFGEGRRGEERMARGERREGGGERRGAGGEGRGARGGEVQRRRQSTEERLEEVSR